VADHPAEGGCSPSATRRPLNVELLAQSRVESAAVVVARRETAPLLSPPPRSGIFRRSHLGLRVRLHAR
jgi:hypothetical protein